MPRGAAPRPNGPEFQSRAVETWALEAKVRQDFIEPGKGDGVVDHLMRVLPGEPIVRPQVIAVERRARFDVLFHFAV